MKFDLRSPRYRHWLWALYLPLYLAAFFLVEHYINGDAAYWVSYWPLVDDAIPFCPPFVLAYYLWFPYMVLTGLYLAFRYPDCFRRYMQTIAVGFTLCTLFFFILPNGQDLRPASFSEDNLFTWMIGLIYAADTNTNVLPSVHAYGSIVVVFAAYDCPAFKPWLRALYILLAGLICASTLFIKQHSILDVIAGVLLAVPIYFLVYAPARRKKAQGGTNPQ